MFSKDLILFVSNPIKIIVLGDLLMRISLEMIDNLQMTERLSVS